MNKVLHIILVLILWTLSTATFAEKYSLTVNATPSDSRIKIMNIVPKYYSGIKLQSGIYDILVYKFGYRPNRQWIRIKTQNITMKVVLKENAANQIDYEATSTNPEPNTDVFTETTNSKETTNDTINHEVIVPCLKKEFVVAIDMGHTIKRHGATSARGVGEFYFNKKFSQNLWKELIQQGFKKAFIINKTGANISLKKRTAIARKKNADLFISIHHDSAQPRYLSSWYYQGKKRLYTDLFNGYSIFISKKNSQVQRSLVFARLLGAELRRNLLVPSLHHAEKIKGENRQLVDKNKGIYRFDELIVLRTAKMPAVLLECGIILNRDEELLLTTQAYQRKLVLSITAAIEQACGSWQKSSR